MQCFDSALLAGYEGQRFRIVKMVVRIRLSRFGNRHQPFYNIVVAHARYASFLLVLQFFFSLELFYCLPSASRLRLTDNRQPSDCLEKC